jgi:hypothetical protein
MKLNLDPVQLKSLWERIVEKFIEKCPEHAPKTLNIDEVDEKMLSPTTTPPPVPPQSIPDLILSDKEIVSEINAYNFRKQKRKDEVSWHKLTEMRNAIKKQTRDDFPLTGLSVIIFSKFLGYPKEDDFIAEFKSISVESEYTGVYYSFKNSKVDEFYFSITKTGLTYTAIFKNFHEEFTDVAFTGAGTHIGKFWHFHLRREKSFVNVTIDCSQNTRKEGEFPMDGNNFPAAIEGIGSASKLFSSEVILINKSNKNLKKDHLSAQRYLSLRRKHFIVDSFFEEDYDKLDGLRAINNQPISTYNNKFSDKHFRVINIAFKKFIVQAKLHIHDNYLGEIIYPDDKRLKATGIEKADDDSEPITCRCLISIENNHTDKIFLISTSRGSLYSYTSAKIDTNTKYLTGAFCFVGNSDKTPLGNMYMMIEDKEMDKSEVDFFEVESFIKTFRDKAKVCKDKGDNDLASHYSEIARMADKLWIREKRQYL